MKKRGHYCKVCGEYKANEKFSGKGHAAHICKTCAALPSEKQVEEMTLTRLVNLPWRLSKEQLSWLRKRTKDRRDTVRALARDTIPHQNVHCQYHLGRASANISVIPKTTLRSESDLL